MISWELSMVSTVLTGQSMDPLIKYVTDEFKEEGRTLGGKGQAGVKKSEVMRLVRCACFSVASHFAMARTIIALHNQLATIFVKECQSSYLYQTYKKKPVF